ncbi:MAG: enoyl-CoA hydratase/isomerase [Henriciella sp.]
MTQAPLVQYELIDRCAVLRLNQPETLNAMTAPLVKALVAAIERAEHEARAIVLTARGRAFCAGLNLKDADIEEDPEERDMGARLEAYYNPLLRRIRDLPIPFITAVPGAAAGVGCSIALMGDLIIAGKGAYFLQAFCRVGLVPDGASAYLLSRAIGRVRAMELMLLGEKYPAEQALLDGLVTRVVEDDQIEAEALKLAKRLADGPPIALEIIRKSAWSALEADFDTQLDHDREMQKVAGKTNDFMEGAAAFREKRPAVFTGT